MDGLARALGPIYWVCRVLGLTNLQVVSRNGKRRYVANKKVKYFNVLVFVLISSAGCSLIKRVVHILDTNPTIKFIEYVRFHINVIVFGTLLLHNAMYSKKQIGVLYRIKKIDSDLRKLGLFMDYERVRNFSLVIIAMELCVKVTYTLVVGLQRKNMLWVIPVFSLITLFISFIRSGQLYQFIVFVFLLKERFDVLHSNLENEIHATSAQDKAPFFLVDTIQKTMEYHLELSDILRTINDMNSVQLLLIISYKFVAVVSDMYNLTSSMSYKSSEKRVVWISAFWMCYVLVTMVILVCTCSSVNRSANNIKTLLPEITIKLGEDTLKSKLSDFSMQLLHDKIEINAGGFFAIDYTLLFAIISSASTYIIILVQFDLDF